MSTTYNKWERFYQRLNVLFNGLVAISLIPFAYIFLEKEKRGSGWDPSEIGITILLFIITICCLFAAHLYWKRNKGQLERIESLADRLNHYLRLKRIQYGLLETAAVLSTLGLWMTQSNLFTALYLVVIFIFSLLRPTFDRVARENYVTPDELQDWGKTAI